MRSIKGILAATGMFIAAGGLVAMGGLAPVPAAAQQSAEGAQPAEEKQPGEQTPIGQRDTSAVDVVATPATDLNLRKGEIPQILLDAQADPYGIADLKRCAQIADAVRQLDAVLGDDIDIAQDPSGKLLPGNVAQSVVGSFIPFRGIIREISGANAQERKFQAAIYAGTARRSFLRGVGLQRGCAWPARPATPAMLAKVAAAREAEAAKEAAKASGK
ncbi:MAG: hypothetical protein FP826_07840 [Sphingomonadales bacterium]|nr:hypothetical protein [Sphingomonadales bacterium]MBU3991137.1 hypothetical protein [Alphaproteobacteria bacterium]